MKVVHDERIRGSLRIDYPADTSYSVLIEVNLLDPGVFYAGRMILRDAADATIMQFAKVISGTTATTLPYGVWDFTNASNVIIPTYQPLDADLTALAELPSTAGMLSRTGADTFAARTLTAPAAGLTISNSTGAAGNPTFALANDLAALEALSTNGYPKRTGTDTWAQQATIPYADLGSLVEVFRSQLSPAAFTGNVNDYNPTNLATASWLRLDLGGASRTMTGLAGGSQGRLIILEVTTSNMLLSLPHDSASSSAANRFWNESGTTIDVGSVMKGAVGGNLALLVYDSNRQRWRVLTRGG